MFFDLRVVQKAVMKMEEVPLERKVLGVPISKNTCFGQQNMWDMGGLTDGCRRARNGHIQAGVDQTCFNNQHCEDKFQTLDVAR